MREWVASKLKLPDLDEIEIDDMLDADADLASFLSECTPARIENLTVNNYSKIFTGIKSNFYINAFSETTARAVKIIFFRYIDFSAEDLQTIVRAAHNAEEIKFNCCCIHCSSDLDFGADLKYNTNFLSFQGWGDMKIEERTTDWKTDPQSFSLIVDAICGSGLKVSLQNLDISYNETLSASKVQDKFVAKGMPNIYIVQENNPYAS